MNGLLGTYENLHISEILNDIINGVVAFILYYPFIYLFFNYTLLENNSFHYIIKLSYLSILDSDISWAAIAISAPFMGLLNRSIVYMFVDTIIIKHTPHCIREMVRNIAANGLKKQLDPLIKTNNVIELDESFKPCWSLEGSFEFVDYRCWIIKDPARKMYWDWEHFLDWVYKIHYQTFFHLSSVKGILIVFYVKSYSFHY
jgi:hypothetical protein